ncbi:MAG: hypothetical protein ACXQT5_03900 [Candidatus Syntropharchaeia archaeon]
MKDGISAKKIIGFVPEESPLYEGMSVKEYLLFFSEIFGIDRYTAVERMNQCAIGFS